MASLREKNGFGILVRERKAISSALRQEPLAHNAVVKEIELAGDQLCFELVEGTGPPTGWAHIAPEGHELLVRVGSREGGGGDHMLVSAPEAAPQKGAELTQAPAAPRRTCHLADDSPPWYEQITSYAHFEQHEELSGMLHKGYTPLKAQLEESKKEDLWDHVTRDESGFVQDDGDPLRFLGEDELSRTDGEEHVVVYKQVAVRRSPSTDGKVIGMKSLGDHLQMFESDLTNDWRSIHFTLRGGWGSTVKAWVMMTHPTLGALVRPYRAEVQKPAKVEVLAAPVGAQPEPGAEGELHEVIQKRMAIRDRPSASGNMLGMSVRGETMRLYEWDSERVFRKVKFQLPDGRGKVDAYVMVEHPKLGTLLRPVPEGENLGGDVCQRCGQTEEGMGDIGLCDACFSMG